MRCYRKTWENGKKPYYWWWTKEVVERIASYDDCCKGWNLRGNRKLVLDTKSMMGEDQWMGICSMFGLGMIRQGKNNANILMI